MNIVVKVIGTGIFDLLHVYDTDICSAMQLVITNTLPKRSIILMPVWPSLYKTD